MSLIQLQARFRCNKVEIRRDQAFFENHDGFDQSGHATGRLQMTNIGLDRSNIEVMIPFLIFAEDAGN